MQVDVSKRKALKMCTGAAAVVGGVVIAPSLIFAATDSSADQHGGALKNDQLGPFTVTLLKDESAPSGYSFIVKNESETPQTLRHVYPGVVSTPNNSFNLNESLPSGGLVVAPKRSEKLMAQMANTMIPEHKLAPFGSSLSSVKVITDKSAAGSALPVVTSRTMFS